MTADRIDTPRMQLRLLLPYQVFADRPGVSRIVAETSQGAFGLWPHRLDCAAALVPGILTVESDAGGVEYVAIDAGVLVKTGAEVRVSVRRAVGGADLQALRDTVDREFAALDDDQRSARTAMSRVEANLMRRLADLRHD